LAKHVGQSLILEKKINAQNKVIEELKKVSTVEETKVALES
jgi:hypothetical protein